MVWTIGDVVQRTGVPASTLRYWERVGLLSPPERVSGRRSYRPDVLDAVALIQLAQAAGLTVADTCALVHTTDVKATPAERWQMVAIPRARELDARIAALTDARTTLDRLLACECASLRECANHADAKHP